MYEVGKAIGQGLVAVGMAKDPEPTTYTKEELGKYFGVSIFGHCTDRELNFILGIHILWYKLALPGEPI